MKKVFNIVVLSDSTSWINTYLVDFINILRENKHKVKWTHNINEMEKCDIAFYLSCSQLVPKEILQANLHNLVVHESALPEGRGWSPLTWKILQGLNEIPITLFEADETVDSGKIYLQRKMVFSGTELVDGLRKKQAEFTIAMCLHFIENYSEVIQNAREQSGTPSYYPKRTKKDSELDINKTILEQINLLRVVDNENYPAFFKLHGKTYIIKIYNDNQ